MTNDDDKDALEAAKKARWETGEWCGDSVEQFEAGWYAHHDMTKAGQELLQAAAEAIAIAKGEAPKDSYRIHIPTKPCTFCLGTGLKSLNDRHNPNSIDCPGCNGTGERPALKCPNPDCHKGVIHYGSDADGWEHFQCETCHGTGEMP